MTSNNLHKINLLPQNILDQRRFELWYPWIISTVIVLLLITGIIAAILGIGVIGQAADHDKTQDEIEITKMQAAELKKYEEDNDFLKARQKIVESALQDRLDAYLLSVALTKSLPGPVSIERLAFDAETGLIIQGVVEDKTGNPTTHDWKAVASTIDALESASIIRNTWLSHGVLNDSYSNYETFDGEIPAHIQSNYPDVVDQFTISADVKITIDTDGTGKKWTDKNAKEAKR